LVTVVLLAGIPSFLVVLSAKLHGAVFYRYALEAILGIVILVILALYRMSRGDSRVGAIILLILTGVFVERFIFDAFGRADLQPAPRMLSAVNQGASPKPMVMDHPLLSLVPEDVPLLVSNPLSF